MYHTEKKKSVAATTGVVVVLATLRGIKLTSVGHLFPRLFTLSVVFFLLARGGGFIDDQTHFA